MRTKLMRFEYAVFGGNAALFLTSLLKNGHVSTGQVVAVSLGILGLVWSERVRSKRQA